MQDYTDFAKKNGVELLDQGDCQFCGAKANRGVHECLEIFNLSFQESEFINNPKYRFHIVDAHALQHPEIHGRWSNHFHLLRLHLIFGHQVNWSYQMSSQLSDVLKSFRTRYPNHTLQVPAILKRGSITSADVISLAQQPSLCMAKIEQWAKDVYNAWEPEHNKIESIAQQFISR